MKKQKVYRSEELIKIFYPDGENGDLVIDEKFYGGIPSFENKKEISNEKKGIQYING